MSFSEARNEATRLQQEKFEAMVLDALRRTAGVRMRVMEFRKYIVEPMREAQIKETLKRLIEKGLIEMTSEQRDPRGNGYKIL